MLWTRAELKEKAKLLLKNDYWNYVVVTFVFMLLMGSGVIGFKYTANLDGFGSYYELTFFNISLIKITGTFIGIVFIILMLVNIFFTNVIQVGGSRFFIKSSLDNGSIDDLFFCFSNHYFNIVFIQFLKNLKIFLWSFVFIIPGIIKSYEYAMIPYILAENPDIDKDEAFLKSKKMMNGNKLDYFILNISFIGWLLLDLVTFNIAGIFYINPYIEVTRTEFYIKIKSLTHDRIEEFYINI